MIEHKKEALLEQEVLSDISPEGQHEKRLSRYSDAMVRKEKVLDFILTSKTALGKDNMISEAKALENCGSFLIFRHYYSVDIYKMVAGCTCKKHLLCALCAIRRAAKYIAIYSQKFDSVLLESKEKEYEEVMITLTVKNGDDLQERFDHLIKSVKRLLQKRIDSLKKNPETDTVFKKVSAAIYSYEVTYKGEDSGYHPHLHMIALVPKGEFEFVETKIKGKKCFVPWELKNGLTEDWYKITKDSFIIDVRRIEKGSGDPEQEIKDDSRLKALVEVFKYALKMNDLDISVQVESYKVLKGRRMIGSFGSLRGVKVSKNLNDEPLDDSELPYIDLMYQYSGVTFGYQETYRGKFDLKSVKSYELSGSRYKSDVRNNRMKRNHKRQQVYKRLADEIKNKRL